MSTLLLILQTFGNNQEIAPLLLATDFYGRDCFWYMEHFQLHDLMDNKVIDQFIGYKMGGRVNVNCDALDYSTSYSLMKNEYDYFTGERIFVGLKKSVTNFNLSEKVH